MIINKSLDTFYESIKEANFNLKENKRLVDDKQEEIQAIINELRNQVIPLKIDINNASAIKKLCHNQINEYKKTVEQWIKETQKYVQGKEFVNQFEESVLLIVFGDVKAGKSALGNFISGFDFKDNSYKAYYTNPQFYVYDYSDENEKNIIGQKKLDQNLFVEDVVEATATIQYFTLLNGLTWVDTPGIHSLTKQNQDLANEYIKFADLILFVTPSNNPCKQDENEELRRLINLDKPLLITITKSDVGKLVIEGGKPINCLIPKSDENRKQQEKFLAEEIEKIGGTSVLEKNKYISISTKLARQGLINNNEDDFLKSNIPLFYEQISKVISAKSVELKMKRPKDELNFVIQELIKGISDRDICGVDYMSQNIINVIEEINIQNSILDKAKIEIISDAKNQLITEVYEYLYSAKINEIIDDEKNISIGISEIIHDCVGKIISDKISSILTDFGNYAVNSYKIHPNIKVEKKYETIEYPLYEMKTVSRNPKGIIEHFENIFMGKKFSETKLNSRMETKQILVGDNYNEAISGLWTILETQINEIIDSEINKIGEEYFSEIKKVFEEILLNLQQLKNKLLQLQF